MNVRAAIALTMLASLTVVQAGSPRPSIADLELRREGTRLHAAWVVDAALPDETLERIHSGISVTYLHRVELVARRSLPLWPAKALGHVQSEATVRYDAITRRYTLSRVVQSPESFDPAVEERETGSLDEARRWLTAVDGLPSIEVPERSRLRVRVRSALGRRYVMWVFPGRVTASAVRRLDT